MLKDLCKTSRFNDFFNRNFLVNSKTPIPLSNPSGLDFFSLGTSVESDIQNEILKFKGIDFSHKRIIQQGLDAWISDNEYGAFKAIADNCYNEFNNYILGGIKTDGYIRALFKYAYLEDICRRIGLFNHERSVPHMNKEPSEVDIIEFSKVDASEFIKNNAIKEIVSNIGYGVIGSFIGGADSDLLIDDTLFEIKTVKSVDLKGTMRQLVGYLMCSVFEDDFIITKNLGIFSTRHNFVIKIAINEMYVEASSENTIHDFLSVSVGDGYEHIIGSRRIESAIEKFKICLS